MSVNPANDNHRSPTPVLDPSSPELAGRTAARLFTTPRQHDRPARERAWLEGARAFSIPFGDISLAAWSWGDREAPPVVLVHGWEGRGSQLAAFADPLVALGFRVVAFDNPAHGATPGTQATLVHFAAALEAVAEHVGPLHGLVAHSFGAAAASIALDRGLAVDRVVYIAPLVSPGAVLQKFTEHLGLSVAAARVFEQTVVDLAGVRIERVDGLRLAQRRDTPLLIVHDSEDREAPVESSRLLEAAWPGSRLLATSGEGHRRILRSRDAIDAAGRFLREGAAVPLTEAEEIDRYLWDREARRRRAFP